ncbi:FkbM family methyltransferase [Halarcobacter sp.]|uniref:FkbM family methyltransferase n=1 Tax=Halarcobacter sp. TaxID=2321133 RepID=UPI0029F5876A|nr:FkbM family methyltransferase [Halarcobacter sp.]
MYNQRKNLKESLELLKRNGFEPSVILDIGVAEGTPDLYNVYPYSFYYLFEPLIEFEEHMQSILQKIKGKYFLVAACDFTGQIKINVHTDHLSGSSILKESMGEVADGNERIIKTLKINDLLKDQLLNEKILIKLDTQGSELKALKGCSEILNNVEVIITEVSMFRFMKDSPDFYDVIQYMKSINFVAYDIIFGWNRPLDGALGQVDIVFVKETSNLRKNHSFSTPEQLRNI